MSVWSFGSIPESGSRSMKTSRSAPATRAAFQSDRRQVQVASISNRVESVSKVVSLTEPVVSSSIESRRFARTAAALVGGRLLRFRTRPYLAAPAARPSPPGSAAPSPGPGRGERTGRAVAPGRRFVLPGGRRSSAADERGRARRRAPRPGRARLASPPRTGAPGGPARAIGKAARPAGSRRSPAPSASTAPR
jgi:hypothetical protein